MRQCKLDHGNTVNSEAISKMVEYLSLSPMSLKKNDPHGVCQNHTILRDVALAAKSMYDALQGKEPRCPSIRCMYLWTMRYK